MRAFGRAGDGQYPAPGTLPAERVIGNVTYVSGGIGQEEAAALRHESNYPLALEFIRNGESGVEFLAGVSVTIKDSRGDVVLDAPSEGPLLLAKLPEGKYRVIAAAENRVPKERDVVVTGCKHEHSSSSGKCGTHCAGRRDRST